MGNMPDSFYEKLGKKNKKWLKEKYPILPKGTKRKDTNGYMRVLVGRGRGCFSSEHRIIFEKHLGRELLEGEVIHHRNGIKDDNRLENLQLLTKNTHTSGAETKHSEDIHRLLIKNKILKRQIERLKDDKTSMD